MPPDGFRWRTFTFARIPVIWSFMTSPKTALFLFYFFWDLHIRIQGLEAAPEYKAANL